MSSCDHVIGKVSDFSPGELKTVEVAEAEVLVVRTVMGKFYAIGAKCPHAGAPLEEGLLCDRRVICPWHKSVFDLETGAVLEPPALDDLPQFRIKLQDDNLLLSIPDEGAKTERANKVGLERPKSDEVFVILGGGAAGLAAAEELRKIGFVGRLLLISSESRSPYDRTLLSKQYLSGEADASWLPLRENSFFDEAHIERLHQKVKSVDTVAKQIVFFDGQPSLSYDALLLATGSTPSQLAVPGGKEHAVTLRTPEDADAIIASARPGASAAVIGSSFIGMEVASSLTQRKLQVTIISPEAVPFEKKLGKPIGEMLQRLHERNGVRFRLGSKVSRIEKQGDKREVILEDSGRVGAELIVVGIGVKPATDYLQDVRRNHDGGVSVDEFLQVPGKSRLFAAGDLAAFPVPQIGEVARIEHWRLAQEHGRLAAQNMFNQRTPYSGVPYFWTSHFNTRFDYVGYASSWDEIIVTGDVEKPDFIAFYVANGRAVAAIAAKREKQAAAFLELLRQGRTLPPAELRSLDLVARLES